LKIIHFQIKKQAIIKKNLTDDKKYIQQIKNIKKNKPKKQKNGRSNFDSNTLCAANNLPI